MDDPNAADESLTPASRILIESAIQRLEFLMEELDGAELHFLAAHISGSLDHFRRELDNAC